MGSRMGSAKRNLSISYFLNMKNVLHFSKKKKKKRERDKERRLCLEPKIKNLKAFLVK